MKHRIPCIFALVVLTSGILAHAQDFDSLFAWQAAPTQAVEPGGEGEIKLTLTVAEGHMVYADDLRLTVGDHEALVFEEWERAQPTHKYDQFSEEDVDQYPTGTHTFSLPFTVASDARGEQTVELQANYRGCSESICFFPQQKRLEVSVSIALAAPASDDGMTAADAWQPGAPAASSGPDFDRLFAWQARHVHDGTGEAVIVNFSVADGHTVYHNGLEVRLQEADGLTPGEPVYPRPTLKYDPFEEQEVDLYPAGSYDFRLPFARDDTTSDVEVVILYQGCSESVCFFPQRRDLTVSVVGEQDAPPRPAPTDPMPEELDAEVGTEEQTAAADPPVPDEVETSAVAVAATGGSTPLTGERPASTLVWLLLIFLGGIGASLLPCVYPIIPITVSVIGASGAKSKWEAFLLSLIFVLGMSLTFAVLGVIAAVSGQLSGALIAHPAFKVFLAVIFVAMALSMFGMFDLRLPPSLNNRLASVGGPGAFGAFTMGLVSGILATPCTGPILVGVLSAIAATGDVFFGFWALFTFAWGLGLLFLAVGTFSGLLATLPRGGGWMDTVKSGFGVAFIALALYYISPLIPPMNDLLSPSAGPIAAGVILAIVGAALGAVHLRYGKQSMLANLRKSAGVAVMAFGLYLAAGSTQAAPPPPPDWLLDYEKAVALGAERNTPVMIDFYTQDCTNCKKLDRETFSHPSVTDAMSHFVKAKIDLTDMSNPEVQRLIAKYSMVGVPLIVFYDSDGNELPQKRLADFESPDQFKERIRDIM